LVRGDKGLVKAAPAWPVSLAIATPTGGYADRYNGVITGGELRYGTAEGVNENFVLINNEKQTA